MIVEDLLQAASTISAITDQSQLLTFVNFAAKELWAAVDFPNTLQEESFQPYNAGASFITLPAYVKAVRGIVPCSGFTTDMFAKPAAFNDDWWHKSPWKWRDIKITPLLRNLEEASLLTIRKVDTRATDEVVITLNGKTDVASGNGETVVFAAGDKEKQTVNSYEDLTSLSKDRFTNTDFEVLDSAGNVVSRIPNNYKDVSSLLIQVLDIWSLQCVQNCQCARVLYKPQLPPFWRTTDAIPSGMEDALLFKVREWLDLMTDDKIDRAEIMATKSTALLTRESYDRDKGKQMPFPMKRNPYIRYPGSVI